MAEKKYKEKPAIVVRQWMPLEVRGIEYIVDEFGKQIKLGNSAYLCRCLASKKKPLCDGSHIRDGFVGNKKIAKAKNKTVKYVGKEISILDNRWACSHDMSCVRELPEVFDLTKNRWITPNAAPAKKIMEVIKKCPSGALSYEYNGEVLKCPSREPAISIEKEGPYKVCGSVELDNDQKTVPVNLEHYCLCRCGESYNMPFCDGSHHFVLSFE